MRLFSKILPGIAWMGLICGSVPGRAQFNGPVTPQAADVGGRDMERGGVMEPSMARDMMQRQLKKLRAQHQQEVLTDTDRMVQVATAMKDEVDKGNKTLTADVMKDADELSKLAKRVSERIKTQ